MRSGGAGSSPGREKPSRNASVARRAPGGWDGCGGRQAVAQSRCREHTPSRPIRQAHGSSFEILGLLIASRIWLWPASAIRHPDGRRMSSAGGAAALPSLRGIARGQSPLSFVIARRAKPAVAISHVQSPARLGRALGEGRGNQPPMPNARNRTNIVGYAEV